jgi:DNA-binding response OmpR family regulator
MGSQFPLSENKRRVLVVEDEFLIAEDLRDILEVAGYEVLGPYGTLSEAMGACWSVEADAAIVDLVLHGESAYPLADVLTRRGIPFGFASGQETAATESAWEQRPFIGKPYSTEEVKRLVGDLLGRI